MKRVFAVALLMMAFASVALADGPDLPPRAPQKPKPPAVGNILLADGPDLPPANPQKPVKPGIEA